MSGNFSFPFVKEALKQRKGDKRKQVLLDTSVVDDCLTVVLSAPVGLSEVEDYVRINFLSPRSAYSDPSFLKNVANSLLLPIDRKRLTDIGSM